MAMTEQPLRPQTMRLAHVRAAALMAVVSLIAVAALAPRVMAQGTVVITAIPGGGWIESTDNTAGGSVQLVAFTEPGTMGNGALELTTAAITDFAGVADPFFPVGIPYSDLTAASWRTFVTGDTGDPTGEAASLRLSGYQDGFSVFTTLTAELALNGGATPDAWQDNTLDDSTMVWQTTDSGDGFCLQTGPGCTFAAFKAQYPSGRFSAIQVAIGTGLPPVTSWTDGVSLTTSEDGTETTHTFDFDVVAAPTPTPVPPNPAPATPVATPVAAPGGGDSGGGAVPNTSTHPSDQYLSGIGFALGSLALMSGVTVVVVRRRRRSR